MDGSGGGASVLGDAFQDVLEGEPGEGAAEGSAPEPAALGRVISHSAQSTIWAPSQFT